MRIVFFKDKLVYLMSYLSYCVLTVILTLLFLMYDTLLKIVQLCCVFSSVIKFLHITAPS